MKRQISKHTELHATVRNALPKQIRLNLCVVALIGLVLVGAGNGRAGDLQVPADYATIQAAVDAAVSGDTIYIAPGVYKEQTRIIDKDLTLIGRPGTILRAYADMELSFPEYSRWLVGILGVLRADVTVSGLTFEGDRLSDDGQEWDLKGITFVGAGGRVEDCRFTGIRASTIGTNAFCRAVEVRNPVSLGTDVVNIEVLRCTFADNVYSIQLLGDRPITGQPTHDPNLLRTTCTINDNTVIGNGPDPTGQQIGIAIAEGVGGEVKRNIITDHSWMEPNNDRTAVAIGLLVRNKPVHIEGNIFRNNQVHCALTHSDGSVVTNNTFEGTAPGARRVGLAFSGEDVMVAGNRFSDMEKGIELFGDDPDFPDIGTASNATLIDNGFCNVDMNYNFQPLATYDLQSTLTCPEPTLDVAQVILLSWPFAYNGYSVESADSAEGPWTALDATAFQYNGMHYVAVPSDGAPGFFRLVKP